MIQSPPKCVVIKLVWGTLISALWASCVYATAEQLFTQDRSSQALTHMQPNMSSTDEDMFILGRSFAHVPWVESPASTTARDGLGPLFNANTCVACHHENRGVGGYGPQGEAPRSSVVQLHYFDNQEQVWLGDPVYGSQISINGTQDVPFEGKYRIIWQTAKHNTQLSYPKVHFVQLNYGPLHAYTQTQLLRAPALIGLGLLEQIPEQQIYAQADPHDYNGDGISGQIQKVWSDADQSHKIGRFGWKNTSASLLDQTAKAAHLDMGLANPFFTKENCTPTQTKCNQAYRSTELDLPHLRLQAIATYLGNLQIPKPQDTQPKGQAIFNKLGCQNCHSNNYTLTDGQLVPAYTDLLLHDMGEDLKGSGPLGREWRTAPLWGLGLNQHQSQPAYLHDGRAKTISEAILWHGGEAKHSRLAFSRLPPAEQIQLITFLRSL